MGRSGQGPAHRLATALSTFLIGLIRIYRVTFSLLFPPTCRYQPTCSHYAEEALRLWGPWKGTALAVRRILRCHPLAPGGWDPVPHPQPTKGVDL
ncbi:MAG: membrane protein insertion efficiency factor YidD [Candidatus Hydrothermae bacterium]|nr:membrane protein insertion efficiency factor YidD [Candidatus Hydrothermae bacterium]